MSEINVTPMVDVMLVLLIIMMLIAPLLQQGVSVKLPVASNTTDKPEVQGQTIIAIASKGALYLNARPIKDDELADKVKDLLENQKEKIVLIKGDEGADYSFIMAAMDQLRKAGIEDIGLITERKRQPGSVGGGQ